MDYINQILKERVSTYGDRTVFQYKDKETHTYNSISWNQLLSQSNQVSKALLHLGFGFEDKIGIISNNKPEWTISDLGILDIRGIVVPFYATASTSEMKYIIDETKMKLLFAGNNEQIEKAIWLLEQCDTLQQIIVYEGNIPAKDSRFIEWNEFLDLGKQNSLSNELISIEKEHQKTDTATIIYTSGTTGVPKGVVLTHDNFLNAFKINLERLQVSDQETSLCFLPLSHVFERTWTLFLLYCGATNVFLENPRKVIDELPKVKPTLMCTVPRFFEKTYEGIQQEFNNWPKFKQKIFNWSVKVGHKYIEYLKDAKKAPSLLESKHKLANKLVLGKLRSIFGGKIKMMPCAGAAIDSTLLRFFHAAGIFVNYGYGATETTATVSCFKSDIYNFDYCGSIMPETEITISDENEILIKAKTVFKEYYNKPEETAKVLKDGWYYSGDKGYVVDNEYLVMTDRIKDLIKTSGGKYVSPQKVELLLGNNPYIDQIVVIGDNRKFVTALIVPSLEKLEQQLNHIDFGDQKAVVKNQKVYDFIKQQIDQDQSKLNSYEKVVAFILLENPFSIENKGMTNTLKIRRRFVEEQFTDELNELYSSF